LKHCFGRCTGISFVDATKIQVCHNRRISSHRVFDNLAAREKPLWRGGGIAQRSPCSRQCGRP
jgi:hypothetical protein